MNWNKIRTVASEMKHGDPYDFLLCVHFAKCTWTVLFTSARLPQLESKTQWCRM